MIDTMAKPSQPSGRRPDSQGDDESADDHSRSDQRDGEALGALTTYALVVLEAHQATVPAPTARAPPRELAASSSAGTA